MSHTRRLRWKAAICPIVVALGLICPIAARAAAAGTAAVGPRPPPRRIVKPSPRADLWRIIQDAGPLMVAIVACSFLVVTFVLERAISLRRGRVIPKPFVTPVPRATARRRPRPPAGPGAVRGERQPGGPVFAGAVRKWGRPSVEVEQAAIDHGERVDQSLRRYLRVFYGVATVGPLLGLMGTVLGMIQTFNVIAAARRPGPGRTAGRRHRQGPAQHGRRTGRGHSRLDLLRLLRQPRRSADHRHRRAGAGSGQHDFRRGAAGASRAVRRSRAPRPREVPPCP